MNSNSFFKKFQITLLAGIALCLLWACSGDDRLGGGYDNVENPALALTFQNKTGSTINKGGVKIFARYQNPITHANPILTTSISSATPSLFKFHDTDLVKAITNAKLAGITWPNADSIEFNALYESDGSETLETFSSDFLLVKVNGGKLYQFQQFKNSSTTLYPDSKHLLTLTLPTDAPVLHLKGSIGTKGLDLSLTQVFVSGSPYWSKIDSSGVFTIDRIAKGKFLLKALSADKKVYTASDSLNSESTAPYNPANWSEADIICIP